MLLARGAAREHEIALRLSLGAGRLRVARQVLVESFLLSGIGSLLGAGVAYFGSAALLRIILTERRPGPPLEFRLQLDVRVLAFTVAIAILTGLTFGLVPALRAMRANPATSLQKGSARTTRTRSFPEKALVVAQVALSIVILSAAGLFVGQLRQLENVNLGFQRDHVLLIKLDSTGSGLERESLARTYRGMLDRLQAVPGISSAALCAVSPISGAGANRGVTVDGYEAAPGEIRNVMENWVSPGYFATLRTPILAGRDFTDSDPGHSRVSIINQTMARYYFGNRSPVGMSIKFDGDAARYEIVGVVGDAKYLDIREETHRTVYLNAFQSDFVPSQFIIRTNIAPASVAPDVRNLVHQFVPTVSLGRVTTLSDQIDGSIVPDRLTAMVSGYFGVLGGLLVAAGIYGLLAYTVARRTREIGVRMALGANRGDVARMVLGQTMSLVIAGIVIGALAALWTRAGVASELPALKESSAIPIAFAVLAMIAIALIAAYIPMRRAALVDPMAALRSE
jgi:predicted permease